MQIAVTELESSIDEQNRESRAMVPVENVERLVLFEIKMLVEKINKPSCRFWA